MKHHLPELKLRLSAKVLNICMTLFLLSGCVTLVLFWKYDSSSWTFPLSLSTAIVIVVTIALLIHRLLEFLGRTAEALIFRKYYNYRKALIDFSNKIGNTLDLEHLVSSMLTLLTTRLQAKQTSLLLIDEGFYNSKFTECYLKTQTASSIMLRAESPLIARLEQENRPITIDNLIDQSDSQLISKEEKADLEAAEVELLCPLKSRGKLLAILTLSKKYQGDSYSTDDINLVSSLSRETADKFENASLYESAKQRANTDELTELFNHGFFQQRLEEEIARSSRYGEVFSLILLDIDDFKKCNDIAGHLEGDRILKNISSLIKKTVRNSDVCFRYGGDEFAIILPQTTVDGGRSVAERIRQGIELCKDHLDHPLSVSVGIASWPTDGVLKDDLIRSSDAALYHSKHTGKNRINIACEVALSQVFRIESSSSQNGSDIDALLKTIFDLAESVDAKDTATGDHSRKVSHYATKMAEEMDFPSEAVERIRIAGLLHDIGKVGIPEQIFKKTGLLTSDEREIIQAHPNLSVSIIQHVDSLRDCLAGIQYHHEHYNGKGYPSGLKGNNIPIDARILAVADSFDAMTSPRPYRKPLSLQDALCELKRCSGTQFDPQVVEILANIANKLDVPSATKEMAYKLPNCTNQSWAGEA